LRLLLDTHVILWSASEPDRLPSSMRLELVRETNQLWYSPISVWEMLLLSEKGRVAFGIPAEKAIQRILQDIPLNEAPLNKEVAFLSRTVALPHKDPADRFLAATAIAYDLTLITADTRLITAKGFSVLAIP